MTTCFVASTHRHLRLSARIAAVTLLLVPLCACQGAGAPNSTDPTADSSTSPRHDIQSTVPSEYYIIAPDDVRTLGYRIDWQRDVTPLVGETLRSVSMQHDGVFAIDNENLLTRLSAANGDRVWGTQLASPMERIHGVAYLPQRNRVYMLTSGRLLEIEAANGTLEGGADLQKIANTAPVVHEQFLIYGSQDGQLVWEAYDTGFMWRSNQIAGMVTLPPVIHDSRVIGIGAGGEVVVLDADSASRLWHTRALDPITVPLAVGHGAVYVAGEDQFITCYDMETGRKLWSRLFDVPLRHPPTLIGDRVYQYVTGHGLLAFEAVPAGAPDGVVAWTAPDVAGVVIGQRGRRLLVWNDAERVLQTVDAERGNVRETMPLPKVQTMQNTAVEDGDIYAAALDGRILKLVPSN